MRANKNRSEKAELQRKVGRLSALSGVLAALLIASLIVLFIWANNPINGGEDQHQRQDVNQVDEAERKADGTAQWQWFSWDDPLASTGDTLSEWVSAVFTATAFGVLVWNLVLTRNMIADTRDIGRKQSRAYLHMSPSKIEAKGITEKENVNIRLDAYFTIENPGLTPAYDIKVLYDICETPKGAGVEINADDFRDSGLSASFISPGGARNQRLSRTWRTKHPDLFKPTGLHCIRVSYIITFKDEFGEARETPITSGTLHEFPKGTLSFLPDQVEFRDS